MTKRVRERVEVVDTLPDRRANDGAPSRFRWKGRIYRVRSILGFWREDTGPWWRHGLEVPQRDLWRVDTSLGIIELVHERGEWRVTRVWD
ncbi:nucleotidyltransferase [Egibacter rhizosphaerae]|uniref:Nucleotidyltransferase n=1 Tax=Egibacter rhizosphaerae TaxID=1670831 RepID=A0A411YAC8_9ACTN|nr:DUF6504 family protein [Egibacter rhizosphaerae]QBI18156.1 nucleotidyltransferase [Egibacter rhizosphaerae]